MEKLDRFVLSNDFIFIQFSYTKNAICWWYQGPWMIQITDHSKFPFTHPVPVQVVPSTQVHMMYCLIAKG